MNLKFLCIAAAIILSASLTAFAQRKETDAVREPLRVLPQDHAFRKVITQALVDAKQMEGCRGVLIIFNKMGEDDGAVGNSRIGNALKKAGITDGTAETEAALKLSPAKEALQKYVIVKIDVFNDKTGVVPNAYKLNEFYGNTYPTFLRYDTTGKFLDRHTASDWQEDNSNNSSAGIAKYLAQWYGE